ncbi:MAG: thioredoxin family protein [Campylobacterota bacterium]|nr:thioredoxin family protein [Campylobacterota bacterium]
MKKIVFITLFLITSAFADINWVEDVDDAYEIALKENKTVMVMLSRKDCPACEYMEGIVFENKNFMSFFDKNFIAVHVDIHEDFVPEGLEYFATPTFYFLDSNEKVLHKIVGGQNYKDFREELELILQ